MGSRFNRPLVGKKLSREEQAREGQAVRSALAALGSNGARAFLNAHYAPLRGRPLDLAIASAAGLRAVEAALSTQARARPDARPESP